MSYSCKLCYSCNATRIDTIDAKSKKPLPISLCNNCGLVQQTEIPTNENLKIYYSHDYRKDYKDTYFPKLKHVYRAGLIALGRINFLQKKLPNNRKLTLLDIGAGGGEFVYLASKRGFDAIGIEPDEEYSSFSKQEYGVDIKTIMLGELVPTSADVVTLFHVYEHMNNPDAVIRKIAQVLSNDGFLFVEVPNIIQKDASPHNIFLKAHLFYYSRYTLIAMASKYFEVIEVEDKGNLKILFKKRKYFLNKNIMPKKEDVELIKTRIAQKGWFEYLFIGGGLLKPCKKIKQLYIEKQIGNTSPKKLLDSLIRD